MTTITANHLYATVTLKATSGPWLNETVGYGLRFCVNGGGSAPFQDRPDLNTGLFTLNTFDCHTDIKQRSVSLLSKAGTMYQNWQGDAVPDNEQVTENDIDFFCTKMMDIWNAHQIYAAQPWTLQYVKLYAMQADGKAPLGPNMWVPTSPEGGNAGNYLSPEVAACVSLYSAHRQKQGRGRLYLGPLKVSVLGADGRFDPTYAAAIRDAVKNVQNSVRTRGTPGASATYAGVIWSRKEPTKASVINKVRVGDEPDYQERRTKGRPEVFIEAAVT